MEIHNVVTDDGYILELHRIPFGKRDAHRPNSTFQRRAVFLQHGMMGTDHFWLVPTSNNSLGKLYSPILYIVIFSNILRFNLYGAAFLLADHGYGNSSEILLTELDYLICLFYPRCLDGKFQGEHVLTQTHQSQCR